MLVKLKDLIKELHLSCLPKFLNGDRRKTIIFYVTFYFLVLTVFLTVFGQIPFFATRNLTQLFQVGWVLTLIPLLMLDYRRCIKGIFIALILLSPFLTYCLFALCFHIPSISFSGTRVILLSSVIFLVGFAYGKYRTSSGFKAILFAFLIGAFLYALIVYFTLLRGYDLDNPIYAFISKNSAGPIFIGGSIIAYYLFSKKNIWNEIIKWFFIVFFIAIIALSKNRAVLITVPIVLGAMLFNDIKKKWVSLLIFGLVILLIVLIFVIPQLYQTIIVNILFNGNMTLDGITSGRISIIIENMQKLEPILGNGNSKFDCMPLSFLCTYGIIGVISLIPYSVLPFYVLHKYKKTTTNKSLSLAISLVLFVYLVNSLLEDFGFFGPGAKTFILWLSAGISSFGIELSGKKNIAKETNRLSETVSNKISKKSILIFIQSLLIVAPLVVVCIPSFSTSIGSTVVERLPSTNKVMDYVSSNDITIVPPVETMCVGQRLTFSANFSEKDADDKITYWCPSSWISNPSISVNQYTGEVTALEARQALVHVYWVGNSSGKYIKMPITNYDKYLFNKIYVSTKPFEKSFEHKEDETISLGVKCTSKIYYDNYYLPKSEDFIFYSSDPNVAVVDEKNGLIKAVGKGECEIKGRFSNSAQSFDSVNKLIIKVSDGEFVPVENISFNNKKPCFQYEEYDLSPVFNNNASDTNYTIDVISGPKYELRGSVIKYLEQGVSTIKITSLNNPEKSITFELTVLENHPISFSCETDRVKIGEKKNAEELGIYINFSSGNRRIISDNDLAYQLYPFKNRAWKNKNGLINNMTTYYAIRKGNISIQLKSNIDENITASFSIKSSVYTEKEYFDLSSGLTVLAMSFVVLVAQVFTIFIDFKKIICSYITTITISTIFIVLTFSIYKFTGFTIASNILILLLTILLLFFKFFKKTRLPYIFFEDPIRNVEKNSHHSYIIEI